jgi:hypothetical protein
MALIALVSGEERAQTCAIDSMTMSPPTPE